MVLACSELLGHEPRIRDNVIGDIRLASHHPDSAPVFSFNAEGLWQGVDGRSVGDPPARLSRWREVLAEARAEGFQ